MKSGSLLLIIHRIIAICFFHNGDFFAVKNYRLFQGNSYLERNQKLQYLQATLNMDLKNEVLTDKKND